jgi:5-methylcytosine-specific restriction endonuclease McrBC regulatory subunit McrC
MSDYLRLIGYCTVILQSHDTYLRNVQHLKNYRLAIPLTELYAAYVFVRVARIKAIMIICQRPTGRVKMKQLF